MTPGDAVPSNVMSLLSLKCGCLDYRFKTSYVMQLKMFLVKEMQLSCEEMSPAFEGAASSDVCHTKCRGNSPMSSTSDQRSRNSYGAFFFFSFWAKMWAVDSKQLFSGYWGCVELNSGSTPCLCRMTVNLHWHCCISLVYSADYTRNSGEIHVSLRFLFYIHVSYIAG